MKIKLKLLTFLSFALTLLFFVSCTSASEFMNYDSKRYIELYDYDSIYVNYDYVQVTDEDIENIIQTELSVNEAYVKIDDRITPTSDDIVLISIDGEQRYYFVGCGQYSDNFDNEILGMAVGEERNIEIEEFKVKNVVLIGIYRIATTNDEEFVLDYYGYSSFKELKTYIKNRATEEIIFNYSYDIIFKNSSLIEYPNEIQNLMTSDIEKYKSEISKEYSGFEEFLIENEMTENEFETYISSGYYELMLYKAILDEENIVITKEDICNYKKENQIEEYSDYDIYKELAYSKIRDIIILETEVK